MLHVPPSCIENSTFSICLRNGVVVGPGGVFVVVDVVVGVVVDVDAVVVDVVGDVVVVDVTKYLLRA